MADQQIGLDVVAEQGEVVVVFPVTQKGKRLRLAPDEARRLAIHLLHMEKVARKQLKE